MNAVYAIKQKNSFSIWVSKNNKKNTHTTKKLKLKVIIEKIKSSR